MRVRVWMLAAVCAAEAAAQSLGGAGTVRGAVRDASGSPAPEAVLRLSNPITGFSAQTRSGPDGAYSIEGIPPNTYQLRVSLPGFQVYTANVTIRSSVPMRLDIPLEIAGQQTSVTVESTALIEKTTISSDIVDRPLIAALPALSPDSGLNDAILYTTAGVAADSNGFFHPLGDHAQVSYVIDGRPVSDQRNKVFSTSIPANAIQSMEVISGSPAAEYGDKTSLVINAVTRSGLGHKPFGSFLLNYGSFGTLGEEATLSAGGPHLGTFLVFNAERNGRFLDTPEFRPLH